MRGIGSVSLLAVDGTDRLIVVRGRRRIEPLPCALTVARGIRGAIHERGTCSLTLRLGTHGRLAGIEPPGARLLRSGRAAIEPSGRGTGAKKAGREA
jgi:hypothetical protein